MLKTGDECFTASPYMARLVTSAYRLVSDAQWTGRDMLAAFLTGHNNGLRMLRACPVLMASLDVCCEVGKGGPHRAEEKRRVASTREDAWLYTAA